MMKWTAALVSLSLALSAAATPPPQEEDEPPRILTLLEQAWAAESGRGDVADPRLALALYCRAGLAGSPEGYYRLGLLLVGGPAFVRNVGKGRAYLGLAAQLGHEGAALLLGDSPAAVPRSNDCAGFDSRSARAPLG